MCLILFAANAHPEYPLIVAANRDEAYARPAAQAAFWNDHPDVFAGRDLERGGTWLGISRDGRFAAITNYRQGRSPDAERSRGELTREYLTGNAAPGVYLGRVEERAAEYNGFSLIVGDPGELWFYSNRGAAAQRIAPGVHGLSNHLLDEPWPKVRRGITELTALLGAGESELMESLLQLLADRAPAPDAVLPSTGIALERERALSASFIEGTAYGTRASTILLVAADGRVLFRERTFGPAGAPAGETEQRFQIELSREARAPARA
jgi:uncharacterized protein with NRDE domain